jgi:hypothetical protein
MNKPQFRCNRRKFRSTNHKSLDQINNIRQRLSKIECDKSFIKCDFKNLLRVTSTIDYNENYDFDDVFTK